MTVAELVDALTAAEIQENEVKLLVKVNTPFQGVSVMLEGTVEWVDKDGLVIGRVGAPTK